MAYRVLDVFAGLALFLLVATPSMKMLIPLGGEALNVLPLFLAGAVLLLRSGVPVWSLRAGHFMFALSLFLLALLAAAFIPPGYLSGEALIKYAVLMSVAIAVPMASTVESVDLSMTLLFLWAAFVAALQISVGIDFGESFHYLTAGLPVAAGMLIALARLFSGAQGFRRWYAVLVLALCLVALLSLSGRGPIIFPVLIVLTFLMVRLVTSRSWKRILGHFSVLLVLGVSAYVAYLTVLPYNVARRIDRMIFTIQDEPRVAELYLPAFDAIIRNPLGYGLDGANAVLGYYPHNIFLEVLLSAGIVGLLLFLPIVFIFVASSWFFMKNRFSTPVYLTLTFLTMFHFLFWNVSHPLSSAYALFSLLVIQGLLWMRLTSARTYDQRCDSHAQSAG